MLWATGAEEGKQRGPHSLPAQPPFLLPKEMTFYSRSHPFPTFSSRAVRKTPPSSLPDGLSNDHMAHFRSARLEERKARGFWGMLYLIFLGVVLKQSSLFPWKWSYKHRTTVRVEWTLRVSVGPQEAPGTLMVLVTFRQGPPEAGPTGGLAVG